jgi:hypothetical protein
LTSWGQGHDRAAGTAAAGGPCPPLYRHQHWQGGDTVTANQSSQFGSNNGDGLNNNSSLNTNSAQGSVAFSGSSSSGQSLTDGGAETSSWYEGGNYAGGSWAFSSISQTLQVSDSYSLAGSATSGQTSSLGGTSGGGGSSAYTGGELSNTYSSKSSSSSTGSASLTMVSTQAATNSLSGGDSYTQQTQGSYANGSYAFSAWNYQSINTASYGSQQTGTLNETLSVSGNQSQTSTNTTTSVFQAPSLGCTGAGPPPVETVTDASGQSLSNSYLGTVMVSDTVTSSQSGTFSAQLNESGSASAGSFAFSSMSYQVLSTSNTSNQSLDSRDTTDTLNGSKYVWRTLTSPQDQWSGFNNSTFSELDTLSSNHTTTQNTTSTYSLYEAGTFGGQSWGLGGYNLEQSSLSTMVDSLHSSTLSQQTGTYTGQRTADGVLMYDLTGTYISSTFNSRTTGYATVMGYNVQEQGSFGQGSFALSNFAYSRQQSSTASVSDSGSSTETFSGSNDANGAATYSGAQTATSSSQKSSSSSGSVSEQGSYSGGSFSLSAVNYTGSGSDSSSSTDSSTSAWTGGYWGNASSSDSSSASSSYSLTAAGSFSGGSFSLSSYALSGGASSASGDSSASQENDNGAASSFSSTTGSQQSDSLYQAGTQGPSGFHNTSYNYQDNNSSSRNEASSGPGYSSSDSWQQQASTQLSTSGTQQASSASYHYQNNQGSGTLHNNGSNGGTTSLPGSAAQFVAPDKSLVPNDGADVQAQNQTASPGSGAPVRAVVPKAAVSNSGAGLDASQRAASGAINPFASQPGAFTETTNTTSGGATAAGVATGLGFIMVGDNFLPAPTVLRVESFKVQAYNSLLPLFTLLSPWAGNITYSMQQNIQGMLDVRLAAPPSRMPYTGDPLVDSIDSMVYNNGQPLTAGSAPLYGTYWDGMGHSAQQALSMAAPYVQGGVFLVAGMWMVGPTALLGATCVAQGALMMGGFDLATNVIGGGNSAMIASGVGQAFYFGAVNEIPGIGNVFAAYTSAKAFSEGDILGGLLAGVDAFRMRGACFTGEMLLDVAGGKKRADAIQVGDRLWSRSEFDPEGELALKEVEEVFVRVAPIVNLHVAGQILRTTAEHPFYVEGKGWLPAGMVEVGDLLRTRCGRLVAVERVADSGEVTTVYNWRIAEYHTYFVSMIQESYSFWAHNACVYQASEENGTVRYVGVANRNLTYDLPRRLASAEAKTGVPAGPLPNLDQVGSLPAGRRGPGGRMGPLTATEAEAIEATLIRFHGREAYGGTLTNVYPGVNVSTAQSYNAAIQLGSQLLHRMGYPGFEDLANIAWREPPRF